MSVTALPYLIDGKPAEAADFVQAACDPGRSVVVQACAGSGKTWLLVARMLRLLLAGAEPAELLAITFTRKAAQEMRERLIHLLRELALGEEGQVRSLLLERGIAEAQLPQVLPVAGKLYDRVLSSTQSLSIDTFHSWFGRLIQIAPLTSGIPQGYSLTERAGELRAEAYRRLMQSIGDERNQVLREHLLALYRSLGDWNAGRLLDAFLDKRAEWWAATEGGQPEGHGPLQWLQELCGADGECDARLLLWNDRDLCQRMSDMAVLLGQGTKRNQERAVLIESAVTDGASLENFARLLTQFRDEKQQPRGNAHRTGKLCAALEARGRSTDWFEQEFADIGEHLLHYQRRSFELRVLALNTSLFAVGQAYVDHYQAVKAEQRVFDFSDLEWHAYRLLNNEDHSAYLQSRLDARYKHILLDEFQDTNPLQWSIVRSWLDAYGEDVQKPTVFIVGDPKQSIYRFRRAEPRVFDAARKTLAAQGAYVLETNQTRRNATSIIEALNCSFIANPIYAPQSTLGRKGGAVWRLPLVRDASEDQAADSDGLSLRDPLTTPRPEQEDTRRLAEGRAVAQALLLARKQLASTSGQVPKWSDVMLLVKKRAHLSAYETALREAGIPFVSDKRGGLLESLEVADLTALLTFLITPCDNLALAHVLKSPLFGAADDDLTALARSSGLDSWWQRLSNRAGEYEVKPLGRAARLLSRWLDAAPRLPVHDLLDMVLHEGELVERYAAAASPLTRQQVLGNIDAFVELALALDAGRYPSLPKFIDALRVLRNGLDNEAPDEALIDASTDAVRIRTIRSAKGLEASIVALLDANHSEAAREDLGILCDWPDDANCPTHFSAFGKKGERGVAREALFAAEERFKTQEDWNLLYVAVTRAKEIFIVSGVEGKRGAGEDGCVEGSWYQRLLAVPEADCGAAVEPQLPDPESDREFALQVFSPPVLGAERADLHRASQTAAMEEGIVLHALLERITHPPQWPVTLPESLPLARWLGCSLRQAEQARAHALTIFSSPQLERFFNPLHYRRAHNEIEVILDGQVMRFDRLVVFDDEVWVLDYKRDLLDSERSSYAAQLSAYGRAAAAVFRGKQLRTALITFDGRLHHFD